MLFEYRYFGATEANSGSASTGLSFAPDTMRSPTFLTGTLRKKIPFRETMSALHQVVVSDLRFKPRDRSAYLEWRAKQDDLDLAQIASVRRENQIQLETLRKELLELRSRRANRWNPFYNARKKFFDWLYKRSLDMWLVLDPVITVHPDEVAFECFSQDESSYGRLACSHEVFAAMGELSYGTTNVDYSYTLYDEFQKIRDDKETTFQVDPAGFEVQTGADESYREVKIDLPESWVRGFLQVSTAMGLPGATSVELHPMDVHNLCFLLRRYKEKHGPRSLRFLLHPGRPVTIRVEPFGIDLLCPRSSHQATESMEIRVWGRRRLLVLERLIPVARKFRVDLMGTGMPSFWIADCGDLTFTLGLSGWTANDWSGSANFDLLAPRGEVDAATAESVMAALRTRYRATEDELATATGLDKGTVGSALVAYAQAGRTMYDVSHAAWRLRELSREPLDLGKLRFSNEREEAAAALAAAGQVHVTARAVDDGKLALEGSVGKERPSLVLDGDRRLVKGECGCRFHFQNKLRKGPCEHLLALRLAFERGQGRTHPPAPPTRPAPPPSPRDSSRRSPPEPVRDSGRPGVKVFPFPDPKPRAERPARPEVPVVRRRSADERVQAQEQRADEEADRFVGLLLEQGLIELGHADAARKDFFAEVGGILQMRGPVNAKAIRMFQLFERHDAVIEFFVLDEADLIGLLEEWG